MRRKVVRGKRVTLPAESTLASVHMKKKNYLFPRAKSRPSHGKLVNLAGPE